MKSRSLLPLLFAALVACSRAPATDASATATPAAMPASLKLESPPAAPQNVVDVKQSAADGAEVVVTGKVMDFVATRAAFKIADLSLHSCADGDDKMECKTPWDYCCEDPARLAAGTTTIEVHEGADVAKGTARGWNGLDHLKQVVVRGKVKKDAQGNVTVIANGIYVAG